MSSDHSPAEMTWYPDRYTRLLLVGVLQIVLGCLSGLMALFLIAILFFAPLARVQAQGMNQQALIPGIVMYVLVGVGLIWLGIGLALARRWAWTLTVVFSWLWLMVGVGAFAMLLVMMKPMVRASLEQQQGKVPPEAAMAMPIFSGACAGCAYILLPAIFLGFCHNEAVRATCLRRDPKVRWTDRCPMPVLALSVVFAFGMVSMLSILAYGPVMPLFGFVLSGVPAILAVVLIELVLAYLAWGTYRSQMAAWWGSMVFGIAGAVNMVVTFWRGDLMALYEKMNMPAEQLDMMRKMDIVPVMSQALLWTGVVGGIAWVGYLLYLRRYFVRASYDGLEPAPAPSR
jgi:hypothetical protein